MSLFFRKNRFAKNDFTEQMLPHNRKEVFFDVVKLHWKSLLLYGLLMLALSLPFHMVSLREIFAISSIRDSGKEANELLVQVNSIRVFSALLKIPCFLIIMLGLAGLTKVIRQYAWEENVHFTTDFVSGFKDNAGSMLLLGLLSGFVYVALVVSYCLAQTADNGVPSIVFILSAGISILIGVPVFAITVTEIPVYSNRLRKFLYNAFVLTMAKPLKTLLTLLCLLLPFAVQCIPNAMVMMLGRMISTLFVPVILLAWMLYSLDLFDKHINAKQFPEIVGRGTYPIDKPLESESYAEGTDDEVDKDDETTAEDVTELE